MNHLHLKGGRWFVGTQLIELAGLRSVLNWSSGLVTGDLLRPIRQQPHGPRHSSSSLQQHYPYRFLRHSRPNMCHSVPSPFCSPFRAAAEAAAPPAATSEAASEPFSCITHWNGASVPAKGRPPHDLPTKSARFLREVCVKRQTADWGLPSFEEGDSAKFPSERRCCRQSLNHEAVSSLLRTAQESVVALGNRGSSENPPRLGTYRSHPGICGVRTQRWMPGFRGFLHLLHPRPARVHHDALSSPANFDCFALPVVCRCTVGVAGGSFSIHLPAHHDDEYAEIEGQKTIALRKSESMKGNARPDHEIDRLLVGLMRPCEGPSPLLRQCPVHPVPSDVGSIEWILSQADKADLNRANLKPSEINMERGRRSQLGGFFQP